MRSIRWMNLGLCVVLLGACGQDLDPEAGAASLASEPAVLTSASAPVPVPAWVTPECRIESLTSTDANKCAGPWTYVHDVTCAGSDPTCGQRCDVAPSKRWANGASPLAAP